MRDVHHHAQAVHLVDHVFAELGEALFGVRDGCVVDVAGAVGPAVGVGPGERHVAHAEGVVLAQQRDGIFDGVAALDPHQRGKLVFAVGLLDAFGSGDEHHLVGVFGRLLLDGVNQLQSPAGVLALV